MDLRDYILSLDEQIYETEELDYRQNDPIRKFQIDYDRSICLTEKFPEAFCKDKEDINMQYCVAPGEGKIPENILMCENWDALAFPMRCCHNCPRDTYPSGL